MLQLIKLKFLFSIILPAFLILSSNNVFAQDEITTDDLIEFKSDIQRKNNETTLQFARRCVPKNSTFRHKILELSFLNPKIGKDIFCLLCRQHLNR